MFNTICPNIHKTLRKRTGLSQDEFGEAVGTTRYTVSKFESGKLQPNQEQERRIMELANCSQIEFVELVCEQLSQLIDKPVGIGKDYSGFEPTTALAQASALIRKPPQGVPGAWIRALKRRIKTTRILSFAFELNHEELIEFTESCREISAPEADMGPS